MRLGEPRAVLGELTSLAAEQGWTEVAAYIAQLKKAERRILVACAPGVRQDQLVAWLRGQDPAAILGVAELDALAADAGPALAADRAVIALHCGDLLMPPTITGAAVVMSRPAGSYVVVLTGAELIHSASDLATVQRAVGGALLGPEGAGRRAGRSLLFWSEGAVSGFLAARVADDTASLARWLAVAPDPSAELDLQRAAHALALAETAANPAVSSSVTESPAGSAGEQDRMLAALHASVAGLHGRVLDHLDAQAASLNRELTASLDTMRHDLLRDIDAQAGGRDSRLVESLVARSMSQWSEECAKVIRVRRDQAGRQAVELLDVIDWEQVNVLASRPHGTRYPEPIVQALTPGQPGPVLPRSNFAVPSSGSAPSTAWEWAPALRTATVGGVVTAAALAALGIAVAPAVGAAAVGVVAATVVGSRRGPGASQRRTETTRVDAAVRAELSGLMSVLSAELDAGSAKLRAAADSEFADLESLLTSAEGRLHAGPAGQDPWVSERLAQLRARLRPGAPPAADLAVLRTDQA
jgi:hypothetical protein